MSISSGGKGISRRFVLFTVFLTFQLFCSPEKAACSEAACLSEDHRTFSVYIENDCFAGGDNQYTSGLKLTWSRFGLSELPDDAWLHKWLYSVIEGIGFDQPEAAEKALTFSIGQAIYTPDHIHHRRFNEYDRPYAGVTYAELGFHKRMAGCMHTLGLLAGIVGPESYAGETQTAFHDMINSVNAKSWDNQLKNEPVLGLVYGYKNRLFKTGTAGKIGNDVIFSAGSCLGNVRVCCNMGLLLRYGSNIPYDFGNFPIQPDTCFNAEMESKFCQNQKHRRFGIHFFLLANAGLVAHDIFLDGNTFTDSHSVDKKPLVGTFMGGLGMSINRFKAVFSYVYRTKTFDRQDAPEIYGSVNLSFSY